MNREPNARAAGTDLSPWDESRAVRTTMQENTTNRNRLALRTRAGLALSSLFAAASFLACGAEEPAAVSSSEDDSAAAYAALSRSLEACEDKLDDCTTDAAGDQAKQAACDTADMRCKQQAQSVEEHARASLKHDADRCKKHGKDDDAGTEDAGAGEMHGCIGRHAPKLPMCVKELLTCLDEAGLRKRDATPKEIGACLHDAHDCFKAELAKKREARRAERKAQHKPRPMDSAAAGSKSSPMAGAPADHAAGAGGEGGSQGRHVRPSILPQFGKH